MRAKSTAIASRHPLVEEVATPLSPAQAFGLFHERPFSFFLDSGMGPQRLGRYSFIGSDPFLVLRSRGSRVSLLSGGEEAVVHDSPFDLLARLLDTYQISPSQSPVPLCGGVVGYFSYDLGRLLERLPATARDDLQLPECYLGFYDALLAFDNLNGKAYVASSGFPALEELERTERARSRLEELKQMLVAGASQGILQNDAAPLTASRGAGAALLPGRGVSPQKVPFPPFPLRGRGGQGVSVTRSECLAARLSTQSDDTQLAAPVAARVALTSNFTRQEYLRAVQRVRQYIIAGDIFQANLSQRFVADLPVAPYELFRRLRWVNPAPFAAYLGFDGVTVASASPERFLRVRGDRVETRPIKGTRPRGKTPQEDEALATELLASEKDRAENVMIVDLERNDLGRVCRFGTVKVTELCALERFPTVLHLTSTVEGQLRPGATRIDLLKATFPGGSITGAPKVRAMEIIEELEPTRRSVYTGSIGYMSFGGEMDLNIAIRTLLMVDGRAYFQVGGGIVYDSNPEAEYQETLDKARGLVQALGASIEAAPAQ
ncbi:MAG: aminodeoxychorismate synthase component I [Chloroflexota bacterium]|nr:aminodeoxychorismate synthase component I [Chloroflexota bacterium]